MGKRTEYHREWRKANKDKCRTASQKYYLSHREELLEKQKLKPRSTGQYRNYHRKYNYGISQEDFNSLYNKQGGRCAICGTSLEERRGGLTIDHNHITDTIRGLLCASCNFGLGGFKDSILLLNNAIEYLENNND